MWYGYLVSFRILLAAFPTPRYVRFMGGALCRSFLGSVLFFWLFVCLFAFFVWLYSICASLCGVFYWSIIVVYEYLIFFPHSPTLWITWERENQFIPDFPVLDVLVGANKLFIWISFHSAPYFNFVTSHFVLCQLILAMKIIA